MSADFETNLVYDSRLNDISAKIRYPIQKGPSDNTYQVFNANSESQSSMNFTVNPPSESTCIDRRMLIRSTVTFQIQIGSATAQANLPIGMSAFEYGLRESCQSFPLNRLFNTVTLSINNVSSSLNQNLCLPALLRMLDPEYMQKCSQTTPAYLDNYGDFTDCAGRSNNPMADYGGAGYENCLLPRGSHPIDVAGFAIRRYNAGVLQDASPISAALTNYWQIDVNMTFVEPLFVSPMLFGDSKFNQSAFLGVNNFQLVINADTQMSRFWSTGLPASIGGNAVPLALSMRGNGFTNSALLLNFLTAPIPLVLPPKVSLPYSSYIAYVTSNQATIAAKVARTLPTEGTYNINSIQLEVIPDKIMVFARESLANQNQRSSDTFVEIKSISCTFGNKSGLLSNANQSQLWKMSRRNGSHQSYREYAGLAGKYTGNNPYVGEYATVGSLVVIDPSYDFGLQSPYLANGSIGQFNLQIQLVLANNKPSLLTPEIVVVCQRSGVVVTSAGSSTLTTNMLNSSIVTQAIESDKSPAGSDEYQRLVGGGSGSGGARSGGMKRSSKLASLAM
jgi:hypothetical protein